ncbi:CDC27 family protein [bacterium]|nr:CDC27 family protein [bacterium]MBU1958498.1 CDC27 family protein [bacterium]
MDNIRELEREWLKYKAKKVMIGVFGVMLVGLLAGGIYYAYIRSQSNVDLLTEKKAEMKAIEASSNVNKPVELAEEATKNAVIPQKVESIISTDKYEVSLEPVIPIVDIEQEERKSTQRTSITPNVRIQPKGVQAKPSTYLTANELLAVHNELDTTKQKKINLNATSKNYMETMKEKFAKNKKPREALLLARAYYAEANYKEAEHWALVANKLNNNLDESWFVFAKAKAKLGQRDEAIKILASYYKKSHSPKAKELIEKIKKGSL